MPSRKAVYLKELVEYMYPGPERRAEEERYTLTEVAQKFGISKGTLVNWINGAGWRAMVNKQIVEGDLRARYLTRSQLEELAKKQRHKIAGTSQTRQRKIIPLLEERVAALERQVAELAGKLEKLSRLAKHSRRRAVHRPKL